MVRPWGWTWPLLRIIDEDLFNLLQTLAGGFWAPEVDKQDSDDACAERPEPDWPPNDANGSATTKNNDETARPFSDYASSTRKMAIP